MILEFSNFVGQHILNDVIPHLETPVIEVIEWLSTYIKVEEFGDAEAIRMDLDDPHYSDIRNSMQQKFKWSQEHLDLVLCLLREDIFSDHARNDRNSSNRKRRKSTFSTSTSYDFGHKFYYWFVL